MEAYIIVVCVWLVWLIKFPRAPDPSFQTKISKH